MPKLVLSTQVSLDTANTLAVPSRAKNYSKVKNVEELKEALSLAEQAKLKVLVLGGGSNVLLPDVVSGLVVHVDIQGIELLSEDQDHVLLKVGAGVVWHNLVEYCLAHQYWGLENLSLIPGTVGAAPIQNIGAYGVELQEVFYELTAVDKKTRQNVSFDKNACEFSYRHSVFKGSLKDQFVIASVTFKLSKAPNLVLHYPVLRKALEEFSDKDISPRVVSQCVCNIRREKLPDPKDVPNLGSFFKNPIITKEQAQNLQQEHQGLVTFPVDETHVKVAAAWLLDQAEWKGFLENGIGFYSQQALVLINPGKRSAKEILKFAERVQKDVAEKFGIMLEREPVSYCDEGSC